MPSRREQIRMSPDEIRVYLEEQRRIILVTIGRDGMPHAVPMNYGLDDEGRIIITAFRKSQKIVNLERDPRATLLAESGETYHELKSVMVYADAEIVTDPDRVAYYLPRMRSSGKLTAPDGSVMKQQVEASMPKRVVILFTARNYVSWDHSKLGVHY